MRIELQFDERSGCVAVYFGPKRNCLDGIQRDPMCLFYACGVYVDEVGHWELSREVVSMAKTLYDRLSKVLAGQREAQEPADAPETSVDATVEYTKGYNDGTFKRPHRVLGFIPPWCRTHEASESNTKDK